MSDDIGPVSGSCPQYPQHQQPEHEQKKEEKFDFSLPEMSIGGDDEEDEGDEE